LGGGLAQTGESCIGRRIKKFARILRNPGLDRFVAAEGARLNGKENIEM
jgi:hypothetical protein